MVPQGKLLRKVLSVTYEEVDPSVDFTALVDEARRIAAEYYHLHEDGGVQILVTWRGIQISVRSNSDPAERWEAWEKARATASVNDTTAQPATEPKKKS